MPDHPDMLITNGRVFDSVEKRFVRADVSTRNGCISAIGDIGQGQTAGSVIDASGMLIVPGLIDLHVHFFRHVHSISINANEAASRSGATSMVDAGSAGALNFPALREYVLKKSRSKTTMVIQ